LIGGTCELSASIDGDRLTLLKFDLTTLEIEALLPVVLASNVMQVTTVSGQFSRFEGRVFCLESLSNATQSFHVECVAPTMLSLDRAEIIINIASGYHCIFASLRNQDAEFGRSLSFCGIRSVMSLITTIVPSQGFAHKANTLTIRGQNFISGKAYECIFGSNLEIQQRLAVFRGQPFVNHNRVASSRTFRHRSPHSCLRRFSCCNV
jgi:hypothetical protein